MRRPYWLATLVALALAASATQAESSAWSPSMLGVGAHGWDWLIGSWSCTNSMPSQMGGPSTTTMTVTRSNAGGLFFRITGQNFDQSGYDAYVSKTKAWINPDAYADGSHSSESTTQTGKTTVWTGTFFDAASGNTMDIRDTYVALSSTKLSDLGESQSAGVWKTQYNLTCTKS